VFLFGLVHGLGFASMLKSFKMSADNFLTTLISFNIGVELAQISISADKPAMAAVAMMDEFNLNSLPVVDKNNQVVGAINTHTH
jgi:CBS domain-containing protein